MSKNSIPKIRFCDFSDNWESKQIGELGSVAMNKRIFKEETSEVGEIPFYKIGTFGSEPDSFITREKFEEYKSKYSYPEIGDILISASGSIGRTVEYKGEEAYFQDSNIVWLKHDERLNNSFLKQFYSIVKWEGIEGTTIKRLYNKNILETPISLPSPAEQSAIGSLFRTLDDLLSSYKDNLTNYQSLKATMLAKMFPKAGQRVPEIRLDGFDGEWEVQTLKELARFSKGNGYTKNDLVNSGKEIILYGQLYTNYQTVISKVNNFITTVKANAVISKGGEVIVPASGESAEDISRASVVEKSGIILGGDLNIIYPDEKKVDSIFLALTISNGSQQKELIKRAQGKSVVHLRNNDLEKVILHYPSMEEQQAIGSYFSNLDNLINSHQEKISQLETLKKKLLQDMFI